VIKRPDHSIGYLILTLNGFNSVMSKTANFILPFTPVAKSQLTILFAAQAAIAIVLWFVAGSTALPSPLEVGAAWVDLASNQGMLFELWGSVKISLVSLLISTLAAVTVAALSTAPIFLPLAKFASSLRFLGFAGLTYLFMLISSDSYWLRVSLLSFGMFVFMITGLLAEIKATPQEQIDHCRTLGMKHWRITYEIILLGKADVTLDLVRQNAAVGWTLLTLVEGMTRSEGGIGSMLLNQNRYFLLAGVFAIQITILLYGLLQDQLLVLLKDVMCPHSRLGKHRAAG
jgi:ABC-type nitrate/sulfonate/bicarbonate transport system permease component